VLLSLTEQGRSLDTAADDTVESAVAHVLANVSSGKIAAAREVLLKVARSLEAAPRAAGEET
jgi:DNA-binding MarR family transcriptional regulator